jgi:hypothetical protein
VLTLCLSITTSSIKIEGETVDAPVWLAPGVVVVATWSKIYLYSLVLFIFFVLLEMIINKCDRIFGKKLVKVVGWSPTDILFFLKRGKSFANILI